VTNCRNVTKFYNVLHSIYQTLQKLRLNVLRNYLDQFAVAPKEDTEHIAFG